MQFNERFLVCLARSAIKSEEVLEKMIKPLKIRQQKDLNFPLVFNQFEFYNYTTKSNNYQQNFSMKSRKIKVMGQCI